MQKSTSRGKIVASCEDLCDYDKSRMETNSSTVESYENLLFDDIKLALTKREADLIYQIYICGFTIAQIAIPFKISRQAVNDIKLKALKKLCDFFT